MASNSPAQSRVTDAVVRIRRSGENKWIKAAPLNSAEFPDPHARSGL
jgi:hypothetical protein